MPIPTAPVEQAGERVAQSRLLGLLGSALDGKKPVVSLQDRVEKPNPGTDQHRVPFDVVRPDGRRRSTDDADGLLTEQQQRSDERNGGAGVRRRERGADPQCKHTAARDRLSTGEDRPVQGLR
ncbi:MAG: hypothetical protein ACREM8_03745 [Vulcanimicrobiaceae bacterium]